MEVENLESRHVAEVFNAVYVVFSKEENFYVLGGLEVLDLFDGIVVEIDVDNVWKGY